MTPEQLAAITDIETLRALVSEKLAVIAARDAELRTRDEVLASRQHLVDTLTSEIARLRRLQYGARTETMDSLQRDLFEETLATEIAALEAQVEAAQEAGRDPAKPRAYSTQTGQRFHTHAGRDSTTCRSGVAGRWTIAQSGRSVNRFSRSSAPHRRRLMAADGVPASTLP